MNRAISKTLSESVGMQQTLLGSCRRDLIDDVADRLPEVIDGSFGSLSQEGFELGEHHLD